MQIKRKALAEWVEGYNQIEAENLEGGEFARMRASASKAAEIAARIAAVLAFIEQAETIERCHVQRAFVLIKYYLSSTAYSRPKLPLIPDEACHPFHAKAATDSTAKLPPRQAA